MDLIRNSYTFIYTTQIEMIKSINSIKPVLYFIKININIIYDKQYIHITVNKLDTFYMHFEKLSFHIQQHHN